MKSCRGTRSTAESGLGRRFRARDASVEAKRIALLYGVSEEDIRASEQFRVAQRDIDEARRMLAVTGHFQTAERYATHGSDVIGLLLDAVWEIRGETFNDARHEVFLSQHLSRYEGEPIVLEFRLSREELLARGCAPEQLDKPFSECFLPERLAAASFTGHWLRGEYVPRGF